MCLILTSFNSLTEKVSMLLCSVSGFPQFSTYVFAGCARRSALSFNRINVPDTSTSSLHIELQSKHPFDLPWLFCLKSRFGTSAHLKSCFSLSCHPYNTLEVIAAVLVFSTSRQVEGFVFPAPGFISHAVNGRPQYRGGLRVDTLNETPVRLSTGDIHTNSSQQPWCRVGLHFFW